MTVDLEFPLKIEQRANDVALDFSLGGYGEKRKTDEKKNRRARASRKSRVIRTPEKLAGRRARAHQWRPPTLIYRTQNGGPSVFRTIRTFRRSPVAGLPRQLENPFSNQRTGRILAAFLIRDRRYSPRDDIVLRSPRRLAD